MKMQFFSLLFSGAAVLSAAPLLPGISDFSWDAPGIRKNAEREQACLNGYWAFSPVAESLDPNAKAPADPEKWGFAKVPFPWQTLRPLNLPKEAPKKEQWHTAWYRRTFQVPENRKNRKIVLEIQHIQTRGRVYVDGKEAGSIVFPGGSLDITDLVRPGRVQELTIRVSAIPSSAEEYVIMDINNIYKVASRIRNKGIVGDVFLNMVPETRIEHTHFITSVARRQITFHVIPANPVEGKQYTIEAEIRDPSGKTVRTFRSQALSKQTLKQGGWKFSASWEDPELWDIDTPENIYTGILRLYENGRLTDITLPETFGFREFTIRGQDYLLNGKPIHLLAYIPGNYSYFWASDKSSRPLAEMTLKRLKAMGYNFAISENYNFNEGATGYIRGFFEAADRTGFLHSFSLPHPRAFNSALDTDPQKRAEYRRMAEYLIRLYWNHPSLVMYATTHNCTGAWGDQNPIRLGGDYVAAKAKGERDLKEKNRRNAEETQKIIRTIDAEHPVYIHSSGSLCGQYTLNMYLNWAPLQERSDWLEHYSRHGKMPLALVEWGPPHSASFSSFRGWVWSRPHVQTAWDAEYVSACYGDRVGEWTPERIELLDRIVRNDGKPIHFGKFTLFERFGIVNRLQGDFFADNYRSMRAWNLSMMLPWDYDSNYIRVPGNWPSKEWPDRYKNLNEPGLVPDFVGHDKYPLTIYPEAYRLSHLGKAIQYWGAPLIGFIGGGKVFTEKEHVYFPGERIVKTLVMINDKRRDLDCDYRLKIKGNSGWSCSGNVRIPAGRRAFRRAEIALPDRMKNGNGELNAEFRFSDGTVRKDTFAFQVISAPPPAEGRSVIALYDPKGLTEALLKRLKVRYRKVGLKDDLSRWKAVVIGREALSAKGALPNLDAVRDGQQVVIFEQQTPVLERLGFRINEIGLRRLFVRDAGNPLLNGMSETLFADWRGESTLLPPLLDYNEFFCPPWKWCGFKTHRVWRCGNRGSLADALIEKPTVGNFLPVLDGGFCLQYAPLLEYREGKGRIVFCQLNLTGRSETEPAAMRMAANLLQSLENPPENRSARWSILGGEAFRRQIAELGFRNPSPERETPVIVAGPGAEKLPDLTKRVENGATVLCFGLRAAELNALFPGKINARDRKNQTSRLADLNHPDFAGISNMDTYFQTRLEYAVTGNGAELERIAIGKGTVIVCSVTADMLDYRRLFHLRTSFRRRSNLMSRLLHNAGIPSECVLLERFRSLPGKTPWKNSFYIQDPVEEDNPYRYYHW